MDVHAAPACTCAPAAGLTLVQGCAGGGWSPPASTGGVPVQLISSHTSMGSSLSGRVKKVDLRTGTCVCERSDGISLGRTFICRLSWCCCCCLLVFCMSVNIDGAAR